MLGQVKFCHVGTCRKEAVSICRKLGQQYCAEHWIQFVENSMLHFDCSTGDHSMLNEEQIRIEDEVNRFFVESEQNRLKAFQKYISMYGDPEQKVKHEDTSDYPPINWTKEEKEVLDAIRVRNGG